MSGLEVATSIALGVGLATATGLRVFIPLLVVSLVAYSGHLHLSENFAWLGTLPAISVLAVAAVAEVLAYYIPAVDNFLDIIATPAALIAGIVVSAAVMTDLPPMVKWITATIAGGGAAGLTQAATAVLRAKSTTVTGGLGNPAVTTLEIVGALLMSALAFIAPLLALAVAVVFCLLVWRLARRLLRRSRNAPSPP
jgi:Domain of unknown function (DUF4126)